MSYPVYTVYSGDVLPILFDSFDGGTGASITMTGLAVTDIEIYKDGATTQRASDAGYTLLDTDGIDFDSITGIHGFSIDTGDNTDAGFYAVGSWYHVVVSSITIDSQTVSFIAAAFRIVAAEAVAGVPVVDVKAISGDATAADNLEDLFEETTAVGNLIDFVDGTGYAGGTIKLATDATLNATQGSYAPSKAGDKMDIIDAPNSTGVTAIVDAFLTRDWSSVSYIGTVRCVLTALQKLRNKVANVGTTQTVYKENDSTSSYTSTITVDAAADPVTSIDPDA